MGTSKQLGQSNAWGIWKPLSVTKHAFFVLCMYRGHTNIFQTYGGIQTYEGHPNIWAHPTIGAVKCKGHMKTP